jgi:hypothetical protein
VVETAADLMGNAEGTASVVLDTKAFPLERRGFAQGRNVTWSTDPLPSNPDYPH